MLAFIAVVIVGIVIVGAGLGRSPWVGKRYVGYGDRNQNDNDH
jgi:hypothetical protein